MKSAFFILSFVATFGFTRPHSIDIVAASAGGNLFILKPRGADSNHFIRIITSSSLKRIPVVLKNLTKTFNNGDLKIDFPLSNNGFTIHLQDTVYQKSWTSATTSYGIQDRCYHVSIDRKLNSSAGDNALATTLIHEIMHCLLHNMYTTALSRDSVSLATTKVFDSVLRVRNFPMDQPFFYLMNMGEYGQHELMYHLLYPTMVKLLVQFANIAKMRLFNEGDASCLMWSGLQNTEEYKKISYEERREIELVILNYKGLQWVATDNNYLASQSEL